MVDGNNGKVLEESNPDTLRHPASLTKIMTLYLLFERLDAGEIRLDTPLKVSAHAAAQAPTKLGVKPGRTITVENAIKAVVTKSANDVAVVIAENLSGSEENFARMMTRKARELGMRHTAYVNASGLPDDDQVTTARDQALLGRALEARFPRYYRYFSTRSFVYHGEAMRNHNRLLGAVDGVDGIKTGFTRASGFNLVASVHRDGRYIIAAVFGGSSASARDAHMRALIRGHIMEASLRHAVPVRAQRTEPVSKRVLAAFGKTGPAAPSSTADHARRDQSAVARTAEKSMIGSTAPIRPLVVRTIPYRTVLVKRAALAPMPKMVPVAAVQPPPPPMPKRSAVPADSVAATGSTRAEAAPRRDQEPPQPPAPAHKGWQIQIGAFGGEEEAQRHLSAARLKAGRALAGAHSFTERVQKSDKAFYRARFAGFDKAAAAATCRQLRRQDIRCLVLKD